MVRLMEFLKLTPVISFVIVQTDSRIYFNAHMKLESTIIKILSGAGVLLCLFCLFRCGCVEIIGLWVHAMPCE